jgi:Carboxypeptidase regulatory-like domain
MTLTVIAAFLLLLQTGKGSIEGVVLNSVTNRPIAGAQLTATKLPTPRNAPAAGQVQGGIVTGVLGGVSAAGAQVTAVMPNGVPVAQIAPVRTDAAGHFIFRDLEAGTYQLRASAEGYAQQDYNQRPGGQSSMMLSVNLTDGQAVKDAVFRLTPGGTLSGRITGSSGEPLVNIEVLLVRSTYDPDGRKTFQQAAAVQTNDRGEYRMFWITPGRYFLSAASSNRPIPGVPFNPGNFSNKYPRTFYPNVADVSSAVPIEVQPAVELSGIDFRLNEQPTYRVRGRVIDSNSAATVPRNVSISIMPRDSVVNTGISFSGNSYNPAEGTFELRDVPSGSHLIRAQLPFNGRPEPNQPPPTPPVAIASVDVAGADVDGVVLTFVPPTSIPGRVRIEGEPLPQNFRASVNLRPATSGAAFGSLVRPAQTNADGTFSLNGIAPGEYRVTANANFGSSQMKLYVKEIRFGATDVLTHPLTVTGSVSDTMEVVFGKDGSKVTGTVRADSQQLLPNVEVVLIPDQRDRHDLYNMTITNATGQFTFPSVPPGSYKAFAWENVERFSWFDPTVLARFEPQGLHTTVNASSDVTLDLKVIPVAGSR